jgi:hypothetical protein
MFVARVKDNPASYSINIDGNAVNLSKIVEWKLYRGNNTSIEIETPIVLSVNQPQLMLLMT